MALTLRSTKGSPLTHNEHDTNHSEAYNFLASGTGATSRTVREKLSDVVSVKDFGAVGDGVTNDWSASNAAITGGAKKIIFPAGTYLLGTDTVITVPTGITIEGDGPSTILRKTSGSADFFNTSGSNVTFRNLRMEGPNNSTCDGILTDGGSDILIENIEAFQLARTVDIGGGGSATDRAAVRNVFSEDNALDGVVFNKATSPRFSNIRSTACGTTNAHHGLYLSDVTDAVGDTVECWNNAGSGIHIFPQAGFASERIEITNINCRGNGTSGSGSRGGVLVSAQATSSIRGAILTNVTLYNNDNVNLFAEDVDELQVNFPYADGNNELVSAGLYFGATQAKTCQYKVSGGHAKAHDSNIRVPVSAGGTVRLQLNDILIADADTGGNAGIFTSGAGTANLDIGTGVKFLNNDTNVVHTAGGSVNYAGTAIPVSSFTGSLTGCTTVPTGTIEWSVNGDLVTLEIPAITGTSNTTDATLTGMPAAIRPASQQTVGGAITTDNSTTTIGGVVVATSGVITLLVGASAVFTASATKGIQACSVHYRLT